MRHIYQSNWKCLRENWSGFLAVSVMLAAAEAFLGTPEKPHGGLVVGTVFANTLIAYNVNRFILFGRLFGLKAVPKRELEPEDSIGRFILASIFTLVGCFLAIALSMTVTIYPIFVGLNRYIAFCIALTFGVAAYLTFMSFFGIALPAAAASARYGISATLNRSRKTFWQVFFGLLFGQVLVALTFIFIVFGVWFGLSGELAEPEFASPANQFLWLIFANLFSYTILTLGIVVLCDAYRVSTPFPALTGLSETKPPIP